MQWKVNWSILLLRCFRSKFVYAVCQTFPSSRGLYPFGVKKKILSSETINNNKKRRIKSKYIKISCESSILSSQYTKQGKYQEKQEIGLWDWINYWRTNSSKCWNFFAKVKSRVWSEILTQFFDSFSHASQLSLMQTFWFFAFNGIKDVNRLRQ